MQSFTLNATYYILTTFAWLDSKMRIDIITIFPKMFAPVLNESIIKRAQNKGKVRIYIHNLRDYTLDKHKKVDDRPFGGGSGMVMSPDPIFRAVEDLKPKTSATKRGGFAKKYGEKNQPFDYAQG